MDNDKPKAVGMSADNTDGVIVEPNEHLTDNITSDTDVTGEEASPMTATPPDSPLAIQSHKIAPKKPKKAPVAILTVLVLLLVGSAAYLFMNRSSEETGSKNAALQEKKDIPHLRYATGSKGWETFYPDTDNSNNYIEANMQIFEGLVRYENKTQIVPLLAQGWTNPDEETWVFTLKKGVKFHTGRIMTPEDVKLSFEAAKGTSNGELFASTIKSIEVTGPEEVTIKTDGPDPILLNKLASYYVFDTKSGKTADPINGTGAYTLKQGFTPRDDALELVAFDDYHGGRPYVRSVSFIDVQTEADKFYEENKADLVTFLTSDSDSISSSRAFTKTDVEAASVFMLPLNSEKKGSPLQNLKVRQAVQLATDPEAVARIRDSSYAPASQILTQAVPGYDNTIVRPTRDVAKAKQLLKEAGYPNGITVTLTYFAPSKTTAEEIARQLKEAGINLRMDPVSEVKDLGAKAFGGGTDMFFVSVSSDLLDASDVFDVYAASANYSDPEIDKLAAEARKTVDAKRRLEILKEISRKLAADVAVVPVYSPASNALIFDPSYVLQRDIAAGALGTYFWKIYAK